MDCLSDSQTEQKLRDVIAQQQKSIERLQNIIDDRESSVPLWEHKLVVEKLENEIIEHAATTTKLMDCQDKLEFALGEVDMLRKQIEREKRQFSETFGKLKHRALKDSVKAVDLENKVHVIEHKQLEQHDKLQEKEEKIKALSEQLKKSREERDKELTDLNIRLQQDLYIARTMEEKDKRAGMRNGKRKV